MGSKITINNNTYEIPPDTTIADAVHSLGFSPDTFIFMIDGRPVPMDMMIGDGSVILSIKVASGG